MVGGLRAWVQYAVVVRAYNSHGAGPLSQPVVVRTLEDGEYGVCYCVCYCYCFIFTIFPAFLLSSVIILCLVSKLSVFYSYLFVIICHCLAFTNFLPSLLSIRIFLCLVLKLGVFLYVFFSIFQLLSCFVHCTSCVSSFHLYSNCDFLYLGAVQEPLSHHVISVQCCFLLNRKILCLIIYCGLFMCIFLPLL